MSVKIGSLKIHISFLFAAAVCFYLNTPYGENFIIVFVCALLHEMMHLIFLMGFGCKRLQLSVLPGGAKISGQGVESLSYKQNLFVCLSAPMLNIFLGVLLFVFYKFTHSHKIFECALINFALGIINLLPMSFLDGGRGLESFLLLKKDIDFCNKAMFVCDLSILLILLTVIIYFMLAKLNFLPLLIFFVYSVLIIRRKT